MPKAHACKLAIIRTLASPQVGDHDPSVSCTPSSPGFRHSTTAICRSPPEPMLRTNRSGMPTMLGTFNRAPEADRSRIVQSITPPLSRTIFPASSTRRRGSDRRLSIKSGTRKSNCITFYVESSVSGSTWELNVYHPERAGQECPCATDAALHRADLTAHDRGGGLIGHALSSDKQECLPLKPR